MTRSRGMKKGDKISVWLIVDTRGKRPWDENGDIISETSEKKAKSLLRQLLKDWGTTEYGSHRIVKVEGRLP